MFHTDQIEDWGLVQWYLNIWQKKSQSNKQTLRTKNWVNGYKVNECCEVIPTYNAGGDWEIREESNMPGSLVPPIAYNCYWTILL